jgi:hypothetical protein
MKTMTSTTSMTSELSVEDVLSEQGSALPQRALMRHRKGRNFNNTFQFNNGNGHNFNNTIQTNGGHGGSNFNNTVQVNNGGGSNFNNTLQTNG